MFSLIWCHIWCFFPSRLFEWLVTFINNSICADKSTWCNFIGKCFISSDSTENKRSVFSSNGSDSPVVCDLSRSLRCVRLRVFPEQQLGAAVHQLRQRETPAALCGSLPPSSAGRLLLVFPFPLWDVSRDLIGSCCQGEDILRVSFRIQLFKQQQHVLTCCIYCFS